MDVRLRAALSTVTKNLQRLLVLSLLPIATAFAQETELSCSEHRLQSDERALHCPFGQLLRGIQCDGRRCSYLKIECCRPEARRWHLGTSTPSPRFPDEDILGYRDPTGFLRGVDRIEDSIGLVFASSQEIGRTNQCTSLRSSHGRPVRCPDAHLASGLQCVDDACKDIVLHCCRYTTESPGDN